MLPRRRTLPHDVPTWAVADSLYFVTVCTRPCRVNHLCREPLASLLLDSVRHRIELGQWHPSIFLIMPDHVHLLAGFTDDQDMKSVIRNWKRYAARHYHIPWQRDFFDHRIRSHESADETVTYIRMNPVRANLIDSADDWPYLLTSDDLR